MDLLSRSPSSAWGLLPDTLEGSGMLFRDRDGGDLGDDRGDGPGDDRGDVQGDRVDPTEYPVEVLSDEEREEAEQMGGFADAADFM